MEKDSFTLLVGEERYECTRYNTELLNFIGWVVVDEVAMDADNFDCILHEEPNEESPEDSLTIYVFRSNDRYNAIRQFMVANRFPAHINQLGIPQQVVDAYNNSLWRAWENEVGNEPQPDA